MAMRGGAAPRLVMKTPIVEMDGDEMTRRDLGAGQAAAARAVRGPEARALRPPPAGARPHRRRGHGRRRPRPSSGTGVGVEVRDHHARRRRGSTEYKLKKAWPSPNGTIRAMLDGTVFRKPIVVRNVPPMVRSWVKPIIDRPPRLRRHVQERRDAHPPGRARPRSCSRRPTAASRSAVLIHEFKASGIVRGVHNLDGSIRSFAKACIAYALQRARWTMWFSGKDTIAKIYHGAFREIFRQEVEARKADFEQGRHHLHLHADRRRGGARGARAPAASCGRA